MSQPTGYILIPVTSSHDAAYVIGFKVAPSASRGFLDNFFISKHDAEVEGAAMVRRSLLRAKAILREICE